MNEAPFKVRSMCKEDEAYARVLSAFLNSETVSSAIYTAIGVAYADLLVSGAMRPAAYYMDKGLAKDPRQ